MQPQEPLSPDRRRLYAMQVEDALWGMQRCDRRIDRQDRALRAFLEEVELVPRMFNFRDVGPEDWVHLAADEFIGN